MSALKIGFLMMLAVSCIFAERKSWQKRLPINDTILVAESHQSLAINKRAPVHQVRLTTVNSIPLSGNQKFCLLIKGVEMQTPPEGVYEVYLTEQQEDKQGLTPESNLFINVIDTYTLTDKNAGIDFCLDASRNIAVLSKRNRLPSNFYVTVLFRGNMLPDKKEVTNAGSLTIGKMQLVWIQ